MLEYLKYIILQFTESRLFKVITKTAFKTILALLLILIIGAAVWFLGFPQSLATIGEKTDNYAFAVPCAALRYSYTKDAEDLARCVEDSIFSGKNSYIIKYGKKLIARGDFDSLCEKKDGELETAGFPAGYKQYICGYVAAAMYAQSDLEGAIALAQEANGKESFVKNNALAVLSIRVADGGSAEDKQCVLAALGEINPTSESDILYLQNLKAILDT